MPDWLKAMAPAPGSAQPAPEEAEAGKEEEEDVTPWLEKLIPGGAPGGAPIGVLVAEQALKPDQPPPAASQAELPDWLQGS